MCVCLFVSCVFLLESSPHLNLTVNTRTHFLARIPPTPTLRFRSPSHTTFVSRSITATAARCGRDRPACVAHPQGHCAKRGERGRTEGPFVQCAFSFSAAGRAAGGTHALCSAPIAQLNVDGLCNAALGGRSSRSGGPGSNSILIIIIIIVVVVVVVIVGSP